MENFGFQYQLDTQYRREAKAQARKTRCRSALKVINGQPGLFRTTLTRLGKTLSTVGNSLQKHYGRHEVQPLAKQTRWPDAA